MSNPITPNTIRDHLIPVEPEFAISESGQIDWVASLVDYNSDLYYRGKTISPEEYNSLFLKQAYQSNYTADSLKTLLNKHLSTVIQRQVQSKFNLRNSFVKIFTAQDWGSAQADGYYYITIPASEHGFAVTDDYISSERLNIDTELYFLNEEGDFYNAKQVEITPDNEVQIYTDDATISGFIIVKTNDKAYGLVSAVISASQVEGLASVALTGDYNSLANRPDNLIQEGIATITDIITGNIMIGSANEAEHSKETDALLGTGTIQNIKVSDIFETGSHYVKNAVNAINVTITNNDNNNNAVVNFSLGNKNYTKTINNVMHASAADQFVDAVNIGNNILPVYFQDGKPVVINRSVPSVTVNNKTILDSNFYAPINAGTYGYVLKSNGVGNAPTWCSVFDIVGKANKTQNGSVILGDGLIIKWGFVSTPSGSTTVNVTFATTHPFKEVFAVIPAAKNGSTADSWVSVYSVSTTGFTYRCNQDRTDCYYIAIGK